MVKSRSKLDILIINIHCIIDQSLLHYNNVTFSSLSLIIEPFISLYEQYDQMYLCKNFNIPMGYVCHKVDIYPPWSVIYISVDNYQIND